MGQMQDNGPVSEPLVLSSRGRVARLSSLFAGVRSKLTADRKLQFDTLIDKIRNVDEAFSRYSFPPVPTIAILPHTRCPYSCAVCYTDSSPSASEKLSLRELKSVVGQAEAMGVPFVQFTGGEPLLDDELLDLIGAFPNMYFLMFTGGGHLLVEKIARLSVFNNVLFVVSVNGLAGANDAIRYPGAFDDAIDAIASLSGCGIPVGFTSILNRATASNLMSETFLSEMLGAGAFLGFYVRQLPLGRRQEMDTDLSPAEFYTAAVAGVEIAESLKLPLVILPHDELFFQMGRGIPQIRPDGFIDACVCAPSSLGDQMNIRTHRLIDVLSQPAYVRIRSCQGDHMRCMSGSYHVGFGEKL